MVISLGFTLNCFAWKTSHKTEIQPFLFYRKIQQEKLSPKTEAIDFYLQSSFLTKVSNADWQFEFMPQILGIGEIENNTFGNDPIRTDPYFLSVKSPDRFMNLRHRLNSKGEWYLELERFNIAYEKDNLEILIGRKPLSLGILKVFAVWNKFSKPLPVTPGPSLVFSSDIFSIRSQVDSWSFEGDIIEENTPEFRTTIFQSAYYHTEFEMHLLAARWWQRETLGFAISRDFLGATFRLESLWLNTFENMPSETQIGFGTEYAISDKTTFIDEFLYQSEGDKRIADYKLGLASRFRSLRAFLYNFAQLQYKVTSLWTASGAALSNLLDGSQILVAKAQYSYSDNTDFVIELDNPTGRKNTEFSSTTFRFPNGATLGASQQFSIGLKTVF